MSIQAFTNNATAQAYISANAGCYVWYDIGRIVVYTGADIPPQPAVVLIASRAQILAALTSLNLLSSVNTYVAGQSAMVQLFWNNAPEFHSDNSMIAAWSTATSQPSGQIQSIFSLAVTLGL
jgi:hypothetical protein